MPIKSSATHYGTVAVTLHWLSALLIVAMIVSGFRATGAEDSTAKASILQFHIPFGMAASGIGMMVLSGAGPIIFGGEASILPDFRDYLPRTPHGFGARLILALFIVHAGAALYHNAIKKDGLLGRMWFAD